VDPAAVFSAIAEPRRRAILLLVRDEPRSVNDIAGEFQISQQAVSQHLQVLREAGLVDVRPEGQRRLYVIRPDGLGAIEEFLAQLWPAKLKELKRSVESGRGQPRRGG
jgi:DNA-binding transcriptional ArsR family regulator